MKREKEKNQAADQGLVAIWTQRAGAAKITPCGLASVCVAHLNIVVINELGREKKG